MPTRGGRPRLPLALRGPGPLPGLCAGPQGSFVPRYPRNLAAQAGSPRGGPSAPGPPAARVGTAVSRGRGAAAAPLQPPAVGSHRLPAAAFARLFALGSGVPCCVVSYFYLCVCVYSFPWVWGFLVLLSARPRLLAAPSAPLRLGCRRPAFIRDLSSPSRRLSRLSPLLLLFSQSDRSPILPHRSETRPPPPRRQVGPGQ